MIPNNKTQRLNIMHGRYVNGSITYVDSVICKVVLQRAQTVVEGGIGIVNSVILYEGGIGITWDVVLNIARAYYMQRVL